MGATIGVLAPVGVPGTAGSDRRMLALLVSLRERSGLNWRVTDSLGFHVPCTYKFTANDSRFEMHCAPASVATCDHMKQLTGAFCVRLLHVAYNVAPCSPVFRFSTNRVAVHLGFRHKKRDRERA